MPVDDTSPAQVEKIRKKAKDTAGRNWGIILGDVAKDVKKAPKAKEPDPDDKTPPYKRNKKKDAEKKDFRERYEFDRPKYNRGRKV